MTQHWWMHWFWVTAGALVLSLGCWCAPQGTMQTGTDPSHYLALLSDLEHPTPVDFAGYEEEDTFAGGANLFPQDPFTAAHLQTTFIPIIVPHLTSEQEEEEHAKDTPATRLAKAIVTTSVPGMPVQYKNRNPFINEEMHVNRNSGLLVSESSSPEPVSVAAPSEAPEVEPSEEPPSAEPEQETNESTPATLRPTESTQPETPQPTEEVLSGGIHPIPPWIPDAKQQDADSEEEEREMEQIDRITNALVEEETAEEGEAITRGRMSPEKGLGTASIVGIALGFVGIICMAGAAAGFALYKRSLLNKPQTLNDKISNPDYSSYIDDTLRVSAGKRLNRSSSGGDGGRPEPRGFASPPYLKDNSEEMYSLDNDSFLNSLEAMTIQNYWTENVKHTKL